MLKKITAGIRAGFVSGANGEAAGAGDRLGQEDSLGTG